ncbi:hypothetical protein HAX54_033416 [Datura stramonium]|uniref:Protein kinase domain-containing protein n=1 Tax=Datura stramonium TaxID=4076 RepID=A0ABS8VEK8_DATST|nr:hypothetical protein [Datura stramonium]
MPEIFQPGAYGGFLKSDYRNTSFFYANHVQVKTLVDNIFQQIMTNPGRIWYDDALICLVHPLWFKLPKVCLHDFVIYARLGANEMWVALHPTDKTKPEFYDAILNGLEIFKINDIRSNLAGPNPVPSPPPALATHSLPKQSFASNKTSKKGIIVGSVVGMAAGLGIVLGLLALALHLLGAEIKHGTKNFDESRVIGVGGFGKVYRGDIDGGTIVAIKRANPSSDQGLHEFLTEIELLSKLRHRHLVSLIGACEENEEMILVYDYMANGTLREHLYKHNKPPLSWKQRLDICIGAARGLHYLHTGARYIIIHRDVKTTNILLDDKWVAKVSDFGLSKTGPNLHQTHVILSGRPALNPSLPKEQVSLADWALQCHRRNTTKELVDPHVKGEIIQECLKQFVDTAVSCLSDHGTNRPSMGSVLWNLEYCLQLHPDGPKWWQNRK